MMEYTKPHLSFEKQVERLQSCGLIIDDPSLARDFLASVNYYRFTGYAIPFMTDKERYKPGTNFNSIMRAMCLDEQLRDLLSSALEIVEIDFRTTFAYEHSKKYGPLGYTQIQNFNFSDRQQFDDMLAKINFEIDKSHELCIQHFRKKYGVFPVWAMIEVASFGIIVKMYKNINKEDKIAVAKRYGIVHKFLESYMHHLLVLRNMCAHHARLWDKQLSFGIYPLNSWRKANLPYVENRRLFYSFPLIYQLLKPVPQSLFNRETWKNNVFGLLNEFQKLPGCNLFQIIGIPTNGFDDAWWE